MKQILFFIALALLATSCLTPNGVQSKLNSKRYPLGYLHDSPIENNKKDIALYTEVKDLSESPNITSVTKKDGHSIWLLFFYSYELDLDVQLGKNSVQPYMNQFLHQSIEKEAKRSGVFTTTTDSTQSLYTLQIDIIESDVQSQYFAYGNGFGNSQTWGAKAAPSNGTVKLLLKLKNDNNTLLEKEYIASNQIDYVQDKSYSQKELNNNFMKNMTETLAECIKECVTNMVVDVNSFLNGQNITQIESQN